MEFFNKSFHEYHHSVKQFGSRFVGLDMAPTCLQMLSANETDWQRVKGPPIEKALVQKNTCKNKNGIVVNDIDTSGYIVAWAIYTSHTDLKLIVCTQTHCFSLLSSVLISCVLVTSWFDSICIQVVCWVNFSQK